MQLTNMQAITSALGTQAAVHTKIAERVAQVRASPTPLRTLDNSSLIHGWRTQEVEVEHDVAAKAQARAEQLQREVDSTRATNVALRTQLEAQEAETRVAQGELNQVRWYGSSTECQCIDKGTHTHAYRLWTNWRQPTRQRTRQHCNGALPSRR